MEEARPVFDVTSAVALLNQTLEYAYPTITVVGELANFKVAKNYWVYADIKDDTSSLKIFGTIHNLPGPLKDGLMVEVVANPRIHHLYGFSLNIISIRPVGEGSIKKASDLLMAKLEKEGLFAPERKRIVPHAPSNVGLITSGQSAAYSDFIKILNARWAGVNVDLIDVQVQGDAAVGSVVSAIEYFNQAAKQPEVLVVIRGGGSPDDLAAFSSEQVTRAVAGSRIPTVVAVGHEIDVSLAELAADMRGSTPSNAAELLFPDRDTVLKQLKLQSSKLKDAVVFGLEMRHSELLTARKSLSNSAELFLADIEKQLSRTKATLEGIHPKAALKRGYALVQRSGKLIKSSSQLGVGDEINITLSNGEVDAKVEGV